MVEFDVSYEGPDAYQGGIANMGKFASDLKNYITENTDKETSIKRVKIEGRVQDQD